MKMTVEQAFDKAMENRQYGETERQDAFAWFKAGWEATLQLDERERLNEQQRVYLSRPWRLLEE